MIEGPQWDEGHPDDDLLQEACGVVGIIDPSGELPIAQMTYSALFGLQHRGEDAAGIMNGFDSPNGFAFQGVKGLGLVAEVFPNRGRIIDDMSPGAIMSVGQTRWATSDNGGDAFQQSQPFLSGELVLAQNGHIDHMIKLAGEYGIRGCVSDGDALTQTLSYLARPGIAGSTLDAMHELFPKLNGGYSLVVADPNTLHGIRDPWGTRPLWLGQFATGAFMFASEQPVLHEAGRIVEEREIAQGEIVSIDRHGNVETSLIQREGRGGRCGLELAYFSRGDGISEGRPIYSSRFEMGRILAEEQPAEADVVIGVPDSGTIAATGYAQASGIPYGVGLIANKYIGRTFIGSTPEIRRQKVMQKLRPVPAVLEGMRVVVVDDSIVRGNSGRPTAELLFAAGATQVHFRSSSPKIVNPCFAGTAISNPDSLFARRFPGHEAQVRELGVTSLGYLSPEGFARAQDKQIGQFCMACMDGDYPFEVPLPEEQRWRLPIQPVVKR